MRCFNHPNEEAIGSCKQCAKGLCGACANDLGHGLACRGVHEQMVESLNDLLVRSDRIQRMTPKTLYVVPLFTIFSGLLFAGYGLFAPRGPSTFMAILGFGFLAYGLVLLVINRRAFKSNGTQA